MTEKVLYHHRTRGRSVEGVHIRSVAGALRELGFAVEILSLPGADPEAPELPASGKPPGLLSRLLSGLASRAPEWLFELSELFYNLVAWWRLRARLKRDSSIWIYERYSLFLFAGVLLARQRGIPIVLEVNDSAVMPRVRPLLMRSLARRIERWVFNHCDGLVFVSSAFRDQVLAAHGTLSAVIISPNAADTSRFDPTRTDRHATRRRLGIDDKLVCGYLGAFIEWHGIHRFIDEAAPQLAKRDDIALLLVGDGKTRTRVEASLQNHGVSNHAVFTGAVPHDQVPELLSAMDVSVLPDSNTYGSPMKLFELMAMGVPVVAPDYGPIAEVIEDGVTGWLFPRGDMQRCLEILLALAPDQIRQVGDQARRYILEHRQWRNNALQLAGLFRQIEADRKRS
ncbi:MAG: glycosyltransferase family 4 protein [Alcanivoracaceae bacterium]|jgi:glycosyltransferase involved in cell wall biosynthesis|nr:glycosyltransferase family 4 protein [Alcanivoracaceae bacterium]